VPNTYTQLLFHVVFSTKNRERTLPDGHRETLYRYIWGIHKNLNCHLYRIGGIDDHVHVLTATPTTISLADYVKEFHQKAFSDSWLLSNSMNWTALLIWIPRKGCRTTIEFRSKQWRQADHPPPGRQLPQMHAEMPGEQERHAVSDRGQHFFHPRN